LRKAPMVAALAAAGSDPTLILAPGILASIVINDFGTGSAFTLAAIATSAIGGFSAVNFHKQISYLVQPATDDSLAHR